MPRLLLTCIDCRDSYLNRNPVYHQVVFASILFLTLYRTISLLNDPAIVKKVPQEKRTRVARTFLAGAGTFAFGFLVWNLDNVFCDTLTGWKKAIGWPAAFLLEGARFRLDFARSLC